jgi:DNA-binding transcriptional MocR family regulator
LCAATFGAIDLLLIGIDDVVPGTVEEIEGSAALETQPDATTCGAIYEVAGGANPTGSTVSVARRKDVSDGAAVATILLHAV